MLGLIFCFFSLVFIYLKEGKVEKKYIYLLGLDTLIQSNFGWVQIVPLT